MQPLVLCKFLVSHGAPATYPSENILLEAEYWLYDNAKVNGIPRQATIPNDSNDWLEVYKIVDAFFAENNSSTRLYEGMYSIWERSPGGQYNAPRILY